METVNITSYGAAYGAAKTIQQEQQRLLCKQFPQFASAIKITSEESGRAILSFSIRRYKFKIGYDTETLREHPELLVIEFGRPGAIGAHTKKLKTGGAKTITVTARGKHGEYTYKRCLRTTALRYRNGRKVDSLGRYIGDFPRSISHIRAGFYLAKEVAAKYYFNELYNVVKSLWGRS